MSTRIFHRGLRSIVLLCGVALMAATAGCALLPRTSAAPEAKVARIRRGEKEGPGAMTRAELQSEVMRFADRFAVTFAQVGDELRRRATNPQVRAAVQKQKVRYVSTALHVATGPNPEINLLDMLVFVTLVRIVGEQYWVPQVYGDMGTALLKALRTLEADIWSIAEDVLTPEQQQELRDLILEWREEHPDQRYVWSVHFLDFAEEEGISAQEASSRPGSLFGLLFLDPLAGLDPAARELEQTRYIAERAMFYIQRTPALVRWQAELLFDRLAAAPETEQFLTATARFTEASERLTKTVERLPDQIAEERRQLILQLESEETRLRGLLADMQQTLAAGSELTSQVNTTVGAIDALAARFDSGPSPRDAEPFDIKDYREAATRVSDAAQQLTVLVESMEQLLASPGWEQRLPQLRDVIGRFEAGGERMVDHAFRRGVVLILIFLVGFVLAMLSYRFTVDKLLGSSQK